jgi:serine phosphatase RsbU (regulator of sigma subunit)
MDTPQATVATQSGQPKGKKKQEILYVDDEANNLTVFKSTFRRHYKVYTALSAHEGLQILRQPETDISLIITDQRMPEETGVEFLGKTVEEFPDAIRIILTGFTDVEAIIEAINRGRVYRYINKPWDENELKVTIDNALETYELKQENRELIEDLRQANQELEEYAHNLEQKVQERTAEIKEQKEIIERKNKDITESIVYARRIQEAMLPEAAALRNTLPRSFIFYQPRDIVSGDFYWFTTYGDYTLVAAVDCTGHGVPGAFMSLIGKNLLDEIVNLYGITEPDQILEQLHLGVQKALDQQRTNNRDGMDIALCRVDHANKRLVYAGAVNPLIRVQDGAYSEIKGTRAPVGGAPTSETVAERKEYERHELSVQEGEQFYIYTDGFQDQFGGDKGRKFMPRHLKNLLAEISTAPPDRQQALLGERLQQWMGEAYPQLDDILVIGFAV